MKKSCIAFLCTLGMAACGGEERPAQAPATTTTTTSDTTTATPQPATPMTTPMPTTPSPAPTMGDDMTMPRSYAPDTTGTPGGATGTIDSSGTTDATGLPGPITPTPPATTPDKTASDQGGGNDRTITAAIRRSVVGQKGLSFAAKNVKIITTGGKVTLRGTVKTEDEKSTIEAKAKATPGVSSVDNQLDVKK